MTIQTLINRNYVTVDAYSGVDTAKELLRRHGALAVTDTDKPIGILTTADLALKPYRLVIDCLEEKPAVAPTTLVSTAVLLMCERNHTALPVFAQGDFFGIVSQTALLTHLQEQQERQQSALLAAAHDLRAPIATISTVSTILRADPMLNNHRYLIEKLSDTCDFAQSFIQDILSIEQFRHDDLSLSSVNFDDLVSECAADVREKAAGKQLNLTTSLQSNRIVGADRHKLKRAISNIVWNSIKFTKPGGVISLTTRSTPGNGVELDVRDNGIGIPETLQHMIFDKFTRARRPGTSGEPTTGLGLYLTKTLIEAHGGSIAVESDGKTGTCFRISLPASSH